MFPTEITELAERVITGFTDKGLRVVTAESCTGGLIAAALTHIPGSSAVVERGFVSYSNDAKTEVLGIMPDVIEAYGAVSSQVAEAMAQGALEFSRADVAISATGIAGPTGATADKPVGLVYLGLATREGVLLHYQCNFKGNRGSVRNQAVAEALQILLSQTVEIKDVL